MKTIILMVALMFAAPITASAVTLSDLDQVEDLTGFSTEQVLDFSDLEDLLEDDEVNSRRRRSFKCVARNRRGNRFIGQAPVRRRARRKAMRRCRNNSRRPRSCQIARCRQQRRGLDDLVDIIDIIDDIAN